VFDRGQTIPASPRLLRRSEYEKMVELGLFEGERVELLYGVVVQMSPKGARHDATIQRLNHLFVLALAPRAGVRVQSAFAASDGSQPEPDLAVVPAGDYDAGHPSKAHLIIEVAESSLEVDRGTKAGLYAECGVPEYWVVNLIDDLIEVHAEIVRGVYTSVVPYRRGASIALCEFPDVAIAVDQILR
jgi:Uma2 family endonuclease